MSRTTTLFKLLAVLTVFSMIVLAGCADDAADDTTTTAAPATTAATTTTTEATTTTTEATTTTAVMVDETTVLAEHITAQLAEWSPVISAQDLFENLSDGDTSNDPFIVSVRAPSTMPSAISKGRSTSPGRTLPTRATWRCCPPISRSWSTAIPATPVR